MNIESFSNIANSTWISSRAIAVRGHGSQATARLGNYFLSQGSETNKATMAAFKEALKNEHGVFGERAFDAVVGTRASQDKSLRASDVKATLSNLQTLKQDQFKNVVDGLLNTSGSQFRELPRGLRKFAYDVLSSPSVNGNLSDCTTLADLERKATAMLNNLPEHVRGRIVAGMDKKQEEVLRLGTMRYELYLALETSPKTVRRGALMTLSNLERLFSPTTWVNKERTEQLEHLKVSSKDRVSWKAGVDGNAIVFHCDKPLSYQACTMLHSIAKNSGAALEYDAMGVTRLVVPKENAERFFSVFTEEKVQQLTHREEYEARRGLGGDPLQLAKTYRPGAVQHPYRSEKPMSASELPEQLDVELNGQVLLLPKIHYEDMATTNSRIGRPGSVGDLRMLMLSRINRGNEILRSLLAGNMFQYEATTENAAALTIALHVAALKKGEFMYRGSFSVADPNGHIARWLDMNPEIYLRTSTHAKYYQEMRVDGHLNMPRGLDVPTGMGGLLNGMRTFHYFTIPDTDHLQDEGRGSGPKRRVFIKCETYGIFYSTAHAHPFRKREAMTANMQTRAYQLGDVIESIQHSASLITSFFRSKSAEGIRKEDIPKEISAIIKNAEDALKANGYGKFADKVLKGVFQGGGIRLFTDNFAREITNLVEHSPRLGDEVADVLKPYLQDIDNALRQLSGQVENRMGNEIMLDAEDFA